MINKKEIVLFTLIASLNFLTYKSVLFGSVLAGFLFAMVLLVLLLTKSVKKTFYWHIFFLLTSLEASLEVGTYSGIVYGYKHLELPGIPISISTIFTILLFILIIMKKKKIIIPKNDLLYRIVVLFFIVPLVTGLIGVAFRNYELTDFIKGSMQPILYLCVYSILINFRLADELNRLKSLVITALIGSVLASYIGAFLGVQAKYGLHITYPANQILWFSPFLLPLSLYFKGRQRVFITLIGIMACTNLTLFNATGKTILFVIFAVIIFIVKVSTNLKRMVTLMSILGLSALSLFFMLGYFRDSIEPSILLKAKFEQLIGFISFWDWKDNLQIIPASPRVRIIETINIFLTLKENFIDLLIGRGFGGYFEDVGNLFRNYDLSKGAFSDREVILGKFVNPHESWNNIFLSTGLLGIYLWLTLSFKLFKGIFRDQRLSFFIVLAFVFVLLLWNTYVILLYFGLICLYIVCQEFQKN